MMFNKNFVAVLKSKGQIVRELSGNVFMLPFDNNYSILMKNQDTRRCVVTITIDGKSIGSSLVMDGSSEMELERFVDTNNKFVFIKKDKDVIKQQGDHIDDGSIVINVKWESTRQRRPEFISSFHSMDHSTGPFYDHTVNYRGSDDCKPRYLVENNCIRGCEPEEGVTAKGESSNQHFTSVSVGRLDSDGVTLSLYLRGTIDEEDVTNVVTTNTKVKCVCGKTIKVTDNYCSECSRPNVKRDIWITQKD